MERNERVATVAGSIQQAVFDALRAQKVTNEEFGAAVQWFMKLAAAGDLPLFLLIGFGFPVSETTDGAAYANSTEDGATGWIAAGPAYVPGAPLLTKPYVLPMREDEPGEPLLISGTVRSTNGEPIAQAELDIWQPNNEGLYSNMTPEMVWPLVVDIDDAVPKDNLRGRLKTDDNGRYEVRTVVPGYETMGVPPGGPLDELFQMTGRATARPQHIHAMIKAEGHHTLTHQIYFAGDPYIERAVEGPDFWPENAYATELHEDEADYKARGLDGPYRTMTCDFVLRPAK